MNCRIPSMSFFMDRCVPLTMVPKVDTFTSSRSLQSKSRWSAVFAHFSYILDQWWMHPCAGVPLESMASYHFCDRADVSFASHRRHLVACRSLDNTLADPKPNPRVDVKGSTRSWGYAEWRVTNEVRGGSLSHCPQLWSDQATYREWCHFVFLCTAQFWISPTLFCSWNHRNQCPKVYRLAENILMDF